MITVLALAAGAGAEVTISTDGEIEADIVSAETRFELEGDSVLSTEGDLNLLLGTLAGRNNTGTHNTFVGESAGVFSTSGKGNTFTGQNAGRNNFTGEHNTCFGASAGWRSEDASDNVFVGYSAANSNITGSQNTVLGSEANLAADDLINATAIGYRALVELDHSLVLGSIEGQNGATEDTYVGIGTASPNSPLDIEAEQESGPNLRVTNYANQVSIQGRSANGTRSDPTASQLDDALLVVGANGHTGDAFTSNNSALIQFSAREDWATDAAGSAIKFATTANGTTERGVRLIIDEDGQVSLGNFFAARKLDVDGNVRVGSLGGVIGCIEDRNGTVIAGTCPSDARFKKDVESFGGVLEAFSGLRPVSYSWRAGEFADRSFGEARSYGLIAQEVEQRFPDLVATDEGGFKSVNYSRLPLLTVQAVKELKAANDALQDRLAQQEQELDELRSWIEEALATQR